MTLTVVVVSLLGVVAAASAAVPANQVAALNDLYASTNGAQWTANNNWLSGDPCANVWHGIFCSSSVMCVAVP
jgi:hypothetical protein